MTRAVGVSLAAAIAVAAEWWLAPRAWEIVTYVLSYAWGHVGAGLWDWPAAAQALAPILLLNLGLVILLALLPAAARVLLARWLDD